MLVCGRVPFDDTSMPILHTKIKEGRVEYPPHLSPGWSRLFCALPGTKAYILSRRMQAPDITYVGHKSVAKSHFGGSQNAYVDYKRI